MSTFKYDLGDETVERNVIFNYHNNSIWGQLVIEGENDVLYFRCEFDYCSFNNQF